MIQELKFWIMCSNLQFTCHQLFDLADTVHFAYTSFPRPLHHEHTVLCQSFTFADGTRETASWLHSSIELVDQQAGPVSGSLGSQMAWGEASQNCSAK